MSWIERIKSNITPTRKASIPEGVWTKCDSCGQVCFTAAVFSHEGAYDSA